MSYEREIRALTGVDINTTAVTLSSAYDVSAYTKWQAFFVVTSTGGTGDFNFRIVDLDLAGNTLRTTTCYQDINTDGNKTVMLTWGVGMTRAVSGGAGGSFTDSGAGIDNHEIMGNVQFGLNVTAGGGTGTIDLIIYARA